MTTMNSHVESPNRPAPGNAVILRPVTTATLAFTEEQKALLKRTIAPECNDDELALFGHICQRTGLDPFARQIYAIKRKDGHSGSKMTIQTSIDGYRLIADRTGCYAGNDAPIYDTETEDHPAWAKVTVYKLVGGQPRPFTAVARWKEYYPSHPNQQFMWNRMGYLLLGKCAEAQALRKAFPQELSRLYTHEEMQQADSALVETVNTVTGEVITGAPPQATTDTNRQAGATEAKRAALKLEITAGLAEVVRPLGHAGLFKAVIYHCFRCAWDAMPSQTLDVFDQGIALFRHLCTELATHGRAVLQPDAQGQATLAPDTWIAQEVLKLAQQAAAEEEDETDGSTGPSWGPMTTQGHDSRDREGSAEETYTPELVA